MNTETTRQEATINLPNPFRRQHDSFELGGDERGGVPVARVMRAQTYLDLAYRMEMIDDGQYGYGQHYAIMRNAYLSRLAAQTSILGKLVGVGEEANPDEEKQLDNGTNPAEQYHEMLVKKTVPIRDQHILNRLTDPTPADELTGRIVLAEIGQSRIDVAFGYLREFLK